MADGIISPKERLKRKLNGQTADRPPVICPGGMMNAAVVEIMTATGHTLPEAHHSRELMTELAADVSRLTGFENFGIPFCMTVEAEVLGSEINYGALDCEPKIQKERFSSAAAAVFPDRQAFDRNRRVRAVTDSIYALTQKYPDTPVVGSLTGPISTAASVIDPMTFLKQLRKDKDNSHRVIDYVTDCLIHYAAMMVEAGADVISVADPTATGEILGPKMFDEYALRYLNKLAGAVRAMGAPVIVHICGKMEAVKPSVARLKANALSVDAFVSLKEIKGLYPHINTMGNLSTIMLEFGNSDKVARGTQALLRNRIDIIAPACGLSTSTPLANIRAFTETVKN
ncbi:MAG: methylcobamide--CoM methyltransferase [Gracilibacteraceae bacterium]|jgi:[methyl-Co(III) methanol-specific corrinoid protein]:coenzyme M methyltransferase|nr:methylcobamide--CoM methyltransferase [Gracilibacteraceae bacterium]